MGKSRDFGKSKVAAQGKASSTPSGGPKCKYFTNLFAKPRLPAAKKFPALAGNLVIGKPDSAALDGP